MQGGKDPVVRILWAGARALGMLVVLLGVLFFVLSVAPARPISEEKPRPRAGIAGAWQEFRAANGSDWSAVWKRECGLPSELRGGRGPVERGTPEEIARAFLRRHAALFALDGGECTLELGGLREGSEEGVEVELRARYRGLDILGATITVVLDREQRVVRVESGAWPVAGLDTHAGIDGARARAIITRALPSGRIVLENEPRLAILPERNGRLVWVAIAAAVEDFVGKRVAREYVVDAQSGVIIAAAARASS